MAKTAKKTIPKVTAKQRGNSGNLKPFPKGVSGNPKGRPKKGLAIAERIREALTDDDWAEIIAKATEQAKAGDKAARDFLLDRTEGKPNQKIAYSETKLEPLEGFDFE